MRCGPNNARLVFVLFQPLESWLHCMHFFYLRVIGLQIKIPEYILRISHVRCADEYKYAPKDDFLAYRQNPDRETRGKQVVHGNEAPYDEPYCDKSRGVRGRLKIEPRDHV